VAAGNLRASRRMKLDITVLPIEDPEAR